ncbi:hypothetical protein R6Q59_010149 [Mikania micrantha]
MADGILLSWDYLAENLQGTQFYRLYRSPPSTLAIFRRGLSNLGYDSNKALNVLHRYHIVKDVKLRAGKAYSLTPDFARSLRRALVGSGDSHPFGEVVNPAKTEPVSVADLDGYARRQWEGILGYMVGTSAASLESGGGMPEPAQAVIALLKAGHLIELTGTVSRGAAPRITKEGFAFVLQDVNTQIWALLFLYVHNAQSLEMSQVEVLSFIFLVSSLELGLAYSRKHLDETQQQILTVLSFMGIIYQPTHSSGEPRDHFYPTRLATTLTSDSPATISATNATLGSSLSQSSQTSSGFIVVETNYRVYAYTSSPLQIALLSLFVNLRSRHPNLVTGKMSKASVQRAVQRGITADQIISFLTSNAHPQMRRRAQAEQALLQARNTDTGRTITILPATILDQIHLWQLERDRMTTTAGFLIKDFQTKSEYEVVRDYANTIGVLVWKSDARRYFFVKNVKGVAEFMAARKNDNAASSNA